MNLHEIPFLSSQGDHKCYRSANPATPTTGISHYAILEKQDGKVTWFEKVSDEEYLKGPSGE